MHAASNGQSEALQELLLADWSNVNELRPIKNEALQQALVAAAANGHIKVSDCFMCFWGGGLCWWWVCWYF